jgi:GAF domain-containing protein
MDLSNAQVQFAFYDEAKDEMSFPLAVEQDDGKMIDRVRLGKREPEYRRTDDDEVVKQFRPRTRKERYGLNEYIVHNQKPLLILENFERKAKEVGVQVFPTFGYLDRPTHSFLGVPMMVGGKAIGAISIQSLEQERAYTQGDVELLSTVSNQAAVAIENARLLEQEKNHIDQLTVLQKAGVKVAAQLHLREVLGTIVENANTALRASFSTLFTYDVEGGRFIEGIRKGKIDTEPSIPSNTGIAAQIASSQGTIWAEKTEDFPNLKPTFIGTKGVQSFVGIPLVAKGKTMGVLFVNYFDFHIFPPRERTVIQLFAEQATVAIENARLYEQIQEANNKLRQAYEDLKQTQEQKLWAELGKTAGSLAHRIGNKGGIIRACVDDLRDHLRETNIEDDVLFEKLGVIQRNTQYMLEMSDLLFKPVQAAETELERVSPALLLRDAIKSADVPSSVVVKIDENIDALPKVLAKKFLVEVFVELIYNALAAMESSPERALDISGQISGDFVELRFKDTGIGIPPEKQETLFDLFVRQPTEKPGRQKHRGFGLWWVKSFLASTNGEVLLEESTIGKGSTFVVRLPLGGR